MKIFILTIDTNTKCEDKMIFHDFIFHVFPILAGNKFLTLAKIFTKKAAPKGTAFL